MKPLDLAVRLRVERRRSHVGHAAGPHERFEFLRDELRPVVADDPRRRAGESFAGHLHDHFNFPFLHGLPHVPVQDRPTVAVEHAAEEVERPLDIDV